MTRSAVQSVRLDIRHIQDGMIALAEDGYRAILEVSGGVDLGEDDARHAAVLAGFAGALNALNYPLQILVRASPVDLSRYISTVQERAREDLSTELAALAHDHAAFVQGLARNRVLLERRFYVVVPAESPGRAAWSTRVFGRSQTSTDAALADVARRQLTFRCEEVARQLARCGLLVRRLSDVEIAHLCLACWSPERARVQRIRQRLEDYTTLSVRSSQSNNHAEPE